jgi:hypothetical protein
MLDQVEGLSDILSAGNVANAAETASSQKGTKRLLVGVFSKARSAYPQIYPQMSVRVRGTFGLPTLADPVARREIFDLILRGR